MSHLDMNRDTENIQHQVWYSVREVHGGEDGSVSVGRERRQWKDGVQARGRPQAQQTSNHRPRGHTGCKLRRRGEALRRPRLPSRKAKEQRQCRDSPGAAHSIAFFSPRGWQAQTSAGNSLKEARSKVTLKPEASGSIRGLKLLYRRQESSLLIPIVWRNAAPEEKKG